MAEPASDWVTRAPAPALRPYVEQYVGYRLAGFPPGVHRGLPSRHLTFIVAIGGEIDVVAQTDPRQAPARYGAVLGGLQAAPALIAHDGNQEGVEIELTPLGSRALLGRPAGDLWDVTLELDEVTGAVGRELWERLQHATTWPERFAACDAVLLRLATDTGPVAPELRWAWSTLVGTAGQVSVADVAAETGWSRQHLTRRFRDEFGPTPKVAARVIRFERAQRMLRELPHVSVTQVAAACGYYDHAHLDRDFAALAGCPPSELLADDLPSFQDGGGADPSSWGHEQRHDLRLARPHVH